MKIRAGMVSEIDRSSGRWLFVDLGFSENSKSCGFLAHDGAPEELRFAELVDRLASEAQHAKAPINLVLEAPLSVAFTARGNPSGRSIEKRGSKARYWYVGLGCSVLVAATYLLRSLMELECSTEIRLFEGLISFKESGAASSHSSDVLLLRDIAWNRETHAGTIVGAESLRRKQDDVIRSAFAVSAMDFGVPPVLAAGG